MVSFAFVCESTQLNILSIEFFDDSTISYQKAISGDRVTQITVAPTISISDYGKTASHQQIQAQIKRLCALNETNAKRFLISDRIF